MEFNSDKFSTVHEDFFGNVVGAVVTTIRATVIQSQEFITEWFIPSPQTPSTSVQ